MNEFLEQFLSESRELVEQATEDLLALEESPEDKGRLDGAFRGFHTLKGAAGIVDFLAMSQVLHVAEDILAAVRAGDHPVTADLVSDCLACLDQVMLWLDVIEATGELPAVPQETVDALVAEFGKAGAARTVLATETAQEPPGWVAAFLASHPAERRQARLALRYEPDPACFFRGEDPLGLVSRLPDLLAVTLTPGKPWPPLDALDPFACNLVITALAGCTPEEAATLLRTVSGQVQIIPLADLPTPGLELPPEALAILEEQLRLAADTAADGFPGRLGSAGQVAARVLQHAGRAAEALAIEEALSRSQASGEPGPFTAALGALLHPPLPPAAPAPATALAPREMAARALRVEVGRVDDLVKLTGELTVVKNAVGYAARLARDKADPDALARMLKDQHALLDRLVGELQRSVLGIRVLPLRHVFQRFPKLVRELAQSLGKSVRLITEGETTEADKAVVEALFEPLLHVIRNALDHGIEGAEERRAAGKPAVAAIRLRAAREGEHVIVEVADDGRGVDLAKVRQVAAQRQVASVDALAQMTERELAELIFAPGFSTASAVTGVSGRGVGMDAVRSAVARMGGRVGIRSRTGHGTNVVFTLPFTVMMSRVMTVEAGDQVFGIPFESVVETVRIPRSQIHRVGAAEAFVLRDQTVPLLSLADALDLVRPGDDRSPEANIVVTTAHGQLGALEVDRFGEPMDVMLKPMEGLLAGAGGVAGTTLLGDGRVLIVLDPQALLQ
jgi:two-component system, chemotaxis family, sensor kinase CheA